MRDLAGRRVGTDALRQQWLLVVVQGAECPTVCERVLYVQRQLREMLGKERDRLEVWLIPTEADTDAPLALRPGCRRPSAARHRSQRAACAAAALGRPGCSRRLAMSSPITSTSSTRWVAG